MIKAIVAEQPGLLEWAKIFAGLVFKDQADAAKTNSVASFQK